MKPGHLGFVITIITDHHGYHCNHCNHLIVADILNLAGESHITSNPGGQKVLIVIAITMTMMMMAMMMMIRKLVFVMH